MNDKEKDFRFTEKDILQTVIDTNGDSTKISNEDREDMLDEISYFRAKKLKEITVFIAIACVSLALIFLAQTWGWGLVAITLLSVLCGMALLCALIMIFLRWSLSVAARFLSDDGGDGNAGK